MWGQKGFGLSDTDQTPIFFQLDREYLEIGKSQRYIGLYESFVKM